jgi:hypothetical protein
MICAAGDGVLDPTRVHVYGIDLRSRATEEAACDLANEPTADNGDTVADLHTCESYPVESDRGDRSD